MLNLALAAERLRARSEPNPASWYRGSACILWTGHVDRQGYPNKVQVGGIVTSAHRLAYWVAFGPIPEQLQIDHRCHDPRTCRLLDDCLHRRCINPDHLEAVTARENTLRSGGRAAANAAKATCPRGHAWDRAHASGRRRCSRCEADLARDEYGARTATDRAHRTQRRRELDVDAARRQRKNRSAQLAKLGLKPDECLNGHPYREGTFRVGPSGKRVCLVCREALNARRGRAAAQHDARDGSA